MPQNSSLETSEHRRDVPGRLIRLCVFLSGVLVFLLSSVTFAGWIAGSERLVFSFSELPVMVPNTALCAALLGFGMMGLAIGAVPRKIPLFLGGLAACIAFATALEWIWGFNLGIDGILVSPFTDRGQIVLGRMSPHTANTLALMGLAVVYFSLNRGENWPLVIPATLAAVSLAIAVAVLVGYGADYRIPMASTMSPRTGISVVLLSLATFGLVHERARLRDMDVRWWFTGPMIAFIVVGVLLVRFGYLLRSAPDEGLSPNQIAQVVSIGMTAFVVAATVASHLAFEQFRARIRLQKLSDDLRQANEILDQRVEERTESLDRHRVHLRNLTYQLTLSEERERRRLSKELHDYLGQMLVVANMHVASAKTDLKNRQDSEPLDRTEEILENCISYTRSLMAQLSPGILFEQGIVETFRWLSREDHGRELEVMLEADESDITLSEEEAVFAYQAVRELVHNVAKHTSAKTAGIEISVDRTEKELVLRVIDEGEGFDASALDREGNGDLSGYGLFGIRERLEILGGSLQVDSAPGEGTTVTIRMRLSVPMPVPVTNGVSEGGGAETKNHETGNGDRIRVVLVEDHHMVREGLRMLLDDTPDMKVVGEAGDGEEALEVIRATVPDVVLMDVNLPRVSGIEVTREIRESLPEMKILALTIHEDDSTRSAMREAGADGVLTKSAIAVTLCKRIRELHTEEDRMVI